MNNKKYLKPSADYVSFYSKEEIMSVMDIAIYGRESDDGTNPDLSLPSGNVGTGGSVPGGWDD